MKIAVPAEVDPAEPRVAATPDTVKKMKALGADVVVQAGAGVKSGMLDADYEAAGATIAPSAADAVRDADVVLKVRRPTEDGARALQAGRARDGDHGPLRQRGRARRHGQGRRRRLRHGADAAHHARAGDGRAVVAGEPRGLSRGDRRARPNSAARFR